MDRKKFIKSAALLAGTTLTLPNIATSNIITNGPKKFKRLKKGIGFDMIKEDISLLDKFKLVKDLGFDGIEFNSPVNLDIKEVLQAKQTTGIEIPSLVNKDHWTKPLSDPDSTVRDYTIASVAKSLHEVKELGGDTVLVVPGVVNEKSSYVTAYNNSLDSIRKLI